MVVVSCATDDELARNLHGYLQASLHVLVDNATVNVTLEGDEIVVDAGSKISKGDVLGALGFYRVRP